MGNMPGNKWVTIYNAKTDEIVALGTQRDCAISMNKKLSDIITLISHVKVGRNHAYTISVEDKETGEYCVYGEHNNMVADGRGKKEVK